MHCPFCAEDDTKVIDSRLVAEGNQVRRRRECFSCRERFTTFETAELVMPRVVKQDGTRQPFDEEKLRSGLMKALEKRPVSIEQIDTALSHIKAQLRATGEREVKSMRLGEEVMTELRQLDKVAYVRFASVYRSFQDVNEFKEEIERLTAGSGDSVADVTKALADSGAEKKVMITTRDRAFMARAVQLAWRGRYSTHPNPRVGCVIARGDRILGESWHERAGEAHAEVRALSQAGTAARGSTAYVTLEPCSHFGRTPPCAKALIEAGVAQVFATLDPNPNVSGRGLEMLRAAGIRVHVGLLADEAAKLNPGFMKRMISGRPWVRLKMAASLDGRTAMASGESQWITGPESRSDVQRLRAMSDAILTGVGTVLADDPSLTVRREEMGDIGSATEPGRQPLRVIADRDTRTPASAKIFRGGKVQVFCATASLATSAAQDLAALGIRLRGVAWHDKGVNVAEMLDTLGDIGINEVLVEAGPTLAGSFISENLVDELWLYQAPVFLGSTGRPTANLPLESMADKIQWQVLDRRQLGADQRLILARR